jgi:hypothetical protein
MNKPTGVIRLLFLPFGFAAWIMGWCLLSVGSIDKRRKSPRKATMKLAFNTTFEVFRHFYGIGL